MTKFDETVVQGFVNWSLRTLGTTYLSTGTRAVLDRRDRERITVAAPDCVKPRALEAEMNRRFRVMESKYRAAFPGRGRRITVTAR